MPIETAAYIMNLRCDLCIAKAKHLRTLGILPAGSQFVGTNLAHCRKKARAAGWRFLRGGRVACPDRSGVLHD